MDVYCYLKVLLKLHQSVLSDGTQERLRMRSTVIFHQCATDIPQVWHGNLERISNWKFDPYQQHGVVNG